MKGITIQRKIEQNLLRLVGLSLFLHLLFSMVIWFDSLAVLLHLI